MTSTNDEQAEFWSGLAPAWLEVADQLESVSGLPGILAMDALSPGPGESVLDVGCGAGRTTIELARRVSPNGDAFGVDIAAQMIAHCRQQAGLEGVVNAEFVTADVQVDDLGAARFDAVFSRFGVMFFADPVAAFGNVRRSLRRGGRLAFACWQNVFENDWMLVPAAAAISVTGSMPPLPEPGGPGPFSLAEADRIRQVLQDAGYSAIEVTPRNDHVSIPSDRIGDFAVVSTRVGGVREMLKDADDGTRQRVIAAIEEAWRARLVGDEVQASRGFHVVTAGG